jgi:hypothetical protein
MGGPEAAARVDAVLFERVVSSSDGSGGNPSHQHCDLDHIVDFGS